jgi:hypothetical protein
MNKQLEQKIKWVDNNPQCKQIDSCYHSLSNKCICPTKQTNLEQKLTPLAQLIELNNQKVKEGWAASAIRNMLIKKAEKLLEEEKQIIMDAYKEGCQDNILNERTDKIRAEQYFNQNFKQ